jgi:DNA-binding Lrp family transcriptional regulator
MDALDRAIVNALQGGFPLSERPFAEVAEWLGTTEDRLIARIGRLLASGVLSRFGPMYHAERMGGDLTLCALAVPSERFEEVVAQVNAHPEVAHNYARDHALNMWLVVATPRPGRTAEVLAAIERETGLPVYQFPKLEEFFVGLRLDA